MSTMLMELNGTEPGMEGWGRLRLLEEAERIEKAIKGKDQDIAALVEDPAARLGAILEAQRERLELTAYLKGLRFLDDAMAVNW